MVNFTALCESAVDASVLVGTKDGPTSCACLFPWRGGEAGTSAPTHPNRHHPDAALPTVPGGAEAGSHSFT